MLYDSPMTTAERFAAKVHPEPNSGCHLWTGVLGAGRCGEYGQVRVDRKCHSAHRYAWMVANGEIPAGMQVLHRCDTPSCVNVDHLFLGTPLDNMLDKEAKGRGNHPAQAKGESSFHGKKTHCPWGHPYSQENTQMARGGKARRCRECRKRERVTHCG